MKKLHLGTFHRDVPAPNLPGGVAHKLSDNYYEARDTRRDHGPPMRVNPTVMQIAEKGGEAAPEK